MFFVNDVVMQSKDDDTFTELRQLVLMEHGYLSSVSLKPQSSEYGTYQTVKARFWPWLLG